MIGLLIVLTFVSHMLLPLALLFWVAFGRGPSKVYRLSVMLFAGGYLFATHLAGGAGHWFGSYWSIIHLLLFLLALIGWSRGWKKLPLLPERKFWPLAKLVLVATLAFSVLLGLPHIQKGRKAPQQLPSVDMHFPLQGGTYYIVQGGNTEALNHHFAVGAQRFSLDIVKLGPWGVRARGLLPLELEKYHIFGEMVHSPCSGEILDVTSDREDTVLSSDPENLAGNYILIHCDEDVTVMLAHLKQASATVSVGDRIERETPLSQVGSSGNSSEPHLHIQAVKGRVDSVELHLRGAQPIPLTFNGKFLARKDKWQAP